MKISQYPRNTDGTPMDLEVGVLTDNFGNRGARLSSVPTGPDGAPINAKALVLVDQNGEAYRFNNFMKPEDYGAAGDGITNDQPAFDLMNAKAALLGYYHVQLRPGATYLVGGQTKNTDGFYQAPVHGIYGVGLRSFIVLGNDAILKTNPGLLFGCWDPATDLIRDYTTGSPAPNTSRAHIGSPIHPVECGFVRVENVELDGNSAAQIIGGKTTTNAIETQHYLLRMRNNLVVSCENVNAHDSLADCGMVNAPGYVDGDARPNTFTNCRFFKAGRNAFSLLGGKGFLFQNCVFSNGGNASIMGGGVLSYAPRSACDIEAEDVIRNARFVNCSFIQGPSGTSCVATGSGDGENYVFEQCEMVGSALIGAPRIVLHDCTVRGIFSKLYGNADPTRATMIKHCFITDTTSGDTPLQGGAGIISGATPTNAQMIDTTVDLSRLPITYSGLIVRSSYLTIRFGTEVLAAGGTAVTIGGAASVTKLIITDAITGTQPGAATPFIVNVIAGAAIENSNIVSAGSNIVWVGAVTGSATKYDNVNGTRLGTAVNGDVALTLYPRKDMRSQIWNLPLTANRVISLNTTNAVDGDMFEVVRTAASTGAFNLNVGTGPLKSIATGQWGLFRYSSGIGGWRLVGFGSL